MAKNYISVSGTTETLIYSRKSSREEYDSNSKWAIKSIRICNTHDADPVTINLKITHTDTESAEYEEYLRKKSQGTTISGFTDWTPVTPTSTSYNILNNVVLNNGVTLVLDETDIAYDVTMYDLSITLSASDSAVDIIIN